MEEMPFFMKKKEWYYYDTQDKKYKLTNEAPSKARKSYSKFYSQPHVYVDENGDEWTED